MPSSRELLLIFGFGVPVAGLVVAGLWTLGFDASAGSGGGKVLTDEEMKARKDYYLEVVRNADNPDRMREPEE